MKFPPRYVVKQDPISGGFGTTFICDDQHLMRDVVIKMITEKTEMPRLIDEITALQKIKSRHVVQIYDMIIINDNNDFALVEEFLPNDDLMQFYSSGFQVLDYYYVLYQVACGVRDIHSCGIVHRDLKPNNIKRDQDGAIKIFDFGLAKIGPLPKTTAVLTGTPGFMAPELFSTTPIIDKPVDAYAFGATAFFLATGALPPTANGLAPPHPLPVGATISNHVAVASTVAQLIDACLDLAPPVRPDLDTIAKALKRELLVNRHRALVADGTNILILDRNNPRIKAARGTFDSIEIIYDGYDFKFSQIYGDIFINNRPAAVGDILDGSYVIVLGASGSRRFVTFDVSHPEVLV
ncbi:serine/threonine protein kinase [Nitrosospira briensis]|uniref:Serine/threonine protein kinase n=1 Tax=Nitrosospira briensis TaxID=35799 RepID=A0A1I5B035_9PROT|nr:serine/threonine-protein kinase [Nitrosospira briensis]SFN68086.1 serine/threonine protein kinase [Nitrosospira briensis]